MSVAGRTNARKRFNIIIEEIDSLQYCLLTTFEEYLDPSLWGRNKRALKIKCNKNHIFTRASDRWGKIKVCPECTGRTNRSGTWKQKLTLKSWRYIEGKYGNKNSRLKAQCVKCESIVEKEYRYFRDKPHICVRVI